MNATNPIADAVNPMRQAAIDHAVRATSKWIEQLCARVPLGADLHTVAPRPHARMSRAEYRMAQEYVNLMHRLFVVERESYRVDAPAIIKARRPEGTAKLLDEAARDAAASFDAYVAKLTGKAGACVSATVTGMLWDGSLLIVTKPDGTVERWYTQQIVNCSSLGKLFNQWPTRKQK